MQQDELRLQRHVETARCLEELLQQPRHRNLARGQPEDRLADGAQRLGKRVHVVHVRHEAHLEMHFGHALVIARNEAAQSLGQEPPHARVQPPHDAEIDRAQSPLGIDEQVSRVHVGVEETVAQRLCQERLHYD